MLKKNKILEILQKNSSTLKNFGISNLSLFGSCVRNEQTTSSDIDFLVEFKEPSFDAYMDLKFYLEELLKAHVDLVIPHTLKERLKPLILKEAIRVPGF